MTLFRVESVSDNRCRHRIDSLLLRCILILILTSAYVTTNVTSFSWDSTSTGSTHRSSDVFSSRCRQSTGSLVHLLPTALQLHYPQHPTEFNIRNDRRSLSSVRLMSTASITNTLLTSKPYAPILNVALDQPLYPPIKKYVFENVVFRNIMGLLPVLLQQTNSILQFIISTITSSRLYSFAFICTTFVLFTRYLLQKNNIRIDSMLPSIATSVSSPSSVTRQQQQKQDVVPMPFDSTINEGWSVCKLKSIVPYTGMKKTKSPYLSVTMLLPQSNYILPLQIGQPIHICGLDRNGNAVQAEFYPFHETRRSMQRSGEFTVLVPDPSKQQLIRTDYQSIDDQSNNSNDIQQLRVIQLLQDYVTTGDTEIAIHPGVISNKLQYRGPHYPVTEIIYVVIGSTAIVPVLDQIRTVLSSSSTTTKSTSSGVARVSVVWITSSMEQFDTLSPLIKREYELHPTQLAVSCGIATHLQDSGITQEVAAEYFYSNNVEMNDTIPNFQPGMMAIISIEGVAPSSAPLLRRVATTYLQEQKGFPLDCTCVM